MTGLHKKIFGRQRPNICNLHKIVGKNNKTILLVCRGYIEAIKEIKEQCGKGNGDTVFDDIVVACGRS